MRLATLAFALAAAVLPGGAHATDTAALHDKIRSLVQSEFRAWGSDPAILAAIAAGNAAHAGLTPEQIDAMDKTWRAEVEQPLRPTIDQVTGNAASEALRARISADQGRTVEAFVMDATGLNVAAAAPISDFWQGDEDKFLKTFGVGPEAIEIGEVEFDESSQTWQVQASFTLTDPATGAPFGAMTIGLNAGTLE